MDHDDRRDVIRRLFTVAGMRIEVTAAATGAGQSSSLTVEQATGLANQLATAAQELVALADAIVLLADDM